MCRIAVGPLATNQSKHLDRVINVVKTVETQSASGIYGPDMTKKDQPKSPPVVEKIGKTPLSASPGTPHLQRVARRQIY